MTPFQTNRHMHKDSSLQRLYCQSQPQPNSTQLGWTNLCNHSSTTHCQKLFHSVSPWRSLTPVCLILSSWIFKNPQKYLLFLNDFIKLTWKSLYLYNLCISSVSVLFWSDSWYDGYLSLIDRMICNLMILSFCLVIGYIFVCNRIYKAVMVINPCPLCLRTGNVKYFQSSPSPHSLQTSS